MRSGVTRSAVHVRVRAMRSHPLTPCTQACAFKLQDAILSSRGVVRLMDMLAEREVIRNETLVLLVTLTRSNEEVQKIVAFEGAFDRCAQCCTVSRA